MEVLSEATHPNHSPGGLRPLMEVLSEGTHPNHSPGGLRPLMEVLSEGTHPNHSPGGLRPLMEVLSEVSRPPHLPDCPTYLKTNFVVQDRQQSQFWCGRSILRTGIFSKRQGYS